MSRDIADLHPQLQPKVRDWMKRCEKNGYVIVVYFTKRTAREQGALYAQGRLGLDEVNDLRDMAGLFPIQEHENRIVTHANVGESFHEYGLALDYVPMREGKPDWLYTPTDPADIYDETAILAKLCGLQWGGDWSAGKKDYGHLEWHPGVGLESVRRRAESGLDPITGKPAFS